MTFSSCSAAKTCAGLALVTLLLCLPGFFSLPPTDRDESRFAQASKQMVETGDYIAIRFQEQARNKKPAGIYWLQALAVHLSGFGADAPIWVYRLPSLLGAVGAVLLTYWALLPLLTSAQAASAALLLALSVLLNVEARLAKTDAMLLALSVAAMGALVRMYAYSLSSSLGLSPGSESNNAEILAMRARHKMTLPREINVIFWLALGFSLLIKGPVVLMIVVLSAAALAWHQGSARWLLNLKPHWGVPLMLAVILPWCIAIFLQTKGAFFADSVGGDMLSKVVGAQETHGGWPGLYALLMPLTFFPGGLFVLVAAPALWALRRDRRVIILLAWLAPAWLMFELLPTKLPHYVLPLYPALAGLAVLGFTEAGAPSARWQRALLWGFVSLPCFLCLFLAGLFFHFEGMRMPLLLGGMFVLIAGAGVAAYRRARVNVVRVMPVLVLLMTLLNLFAFELTLPRFSAYQLSARLQDALMSIEPDRAKWRIASAGYHEPSLVFLTRTDTLLTGGAGAADFLAAQQLMKQAGGYDRLALVDEAPGKNGEEPAVTAFRETALRLSLDLVKLTTVEGRNVNGGHERRIGIYRLKQE